MSVPSVGNVAVVDSSLMVVGRSNKRNGLIITNTGSQPAYVGPRSSVSIASGYELLPAASLVTTIGEEWWVISNATGTTVSFIDDCG